MANAKLAIDAVLRQEDATLKGVVTNYRQDAGGLTRYGLSSRFHPELVAAGFFDAEKMPAAQALPVAEKAYASCYEKQLCLDQIESQSVATALLSFTVNEGQHEAVVLLQRALCAAGQHLSADGEVGPETIAAINAVDGHKLVQTYCEFEEVFYRNVVRANPSQAVWLPGWENRVTNLERLCTV